MAKKTPALPSSTDTVISKGVHVKGNLAADHDMWIDGNVEGNVSAKGQVTIGENARISGDVEAETITIMGTVSGNLKAAEVTCKSSAHMTGNIDTEALSVESGSIISGEVVMPKPLSDTDEEE